MSTCVSIYSQKNDPAQEKTAREIARFSEKDAETWLAITTLFQMDEFQRVMAYTTCATRPRG
jgi:hypothetical protein